MAALVVIACFAEVGRGYASELEKFFLWLRGIKDCGSTATAKVQWAPTTPASRPPHYKADQEDFQPDF